MKRFLILYATREGQTEKIATRIAAHLREAGATVTLVDARDANATAHLGLESFDGLVFGASMHAGGLEHELVEFINSHRASIAAKTKSFFLVLLSAATPDRALRERSIADARNKLERQLDVGFEHIEMIAGALTYSKYPLPLKWLMRRIARQAGGDTDMSRDYEYTDWDQVERYASSLLDE